MKPYPSSRYRKEHGLTLAELMVSMGIGLIILTAISMLFTNNSKLQVELDKANRLIDNGRYALELLSENLRLSGYYGEFDPATITIPGSLPDPCKVSAGVADLSELRNGLGFHIQAYDAADSSSTASPPASCGLSGLIKPGSDVLVIRRVVTTSTAHASVPVGNTTVYVQGTQCDMDLPAYKLDVNPSNLDRLTLQCGTSAAKAPVGRLVQEIYFVAIDNVTGDGIPTLKKVELRIDGTFSTPVPLVEGIEFLQFSYGLDLPPPPLGPIGAAIDGVPDIYDDCDGSTCNADWDKVVSVKIYAIARNIEQTKDYTDPKTYNLGVGGSFTPTGGAVRYRRQAYMETVRLPNPALRRELP
jgi:type IV pilus assembly protein PilW